MRPTLAVGSTHIQLPQRHQNQRRQFTVGKRKSKLITCTVHIHTNYSRCTKRKYYFYMRICNYVLTGSSSWCMSMSNNPNECNRMKCSQFACEISATIASAANVPWNATKTKRRGRETHNYNRFPEIFSPDCIRVCICMFPLCTHCASEVEPNIFAFFQLKFGKMSVCLCLCSCVFHSNLYSLKCECVFVRSLINDNINAPYVLWVDFQFLSCFCCIFYSKNRAYLTQNKYLNMDYSHSENSLISIWIVQ